MTSERNAEFSHIGDQHYGYDMVVGVTQQSINATMKKYLMDGKQADFIVLYCYDPKDDTKTVEMDYNKFLKTVGNLDPFSIPSTATSDDPRVNTLGEHDFAFAFKARVGVPAELPPVKIPDFVKLGTSSSAVQFNLMCAQFQICQITYGRHSCKWFAATQDPLQPWQFVQKVDLRLSDLPDTAFSQLPKHAQDLIKNLGADAFSVQQLYLDLSCAQLQSVPEIKGVDPASDLYSGLTKYFCGKYWTAAHDNKGGLPVLGYSMKATDKYKGPDSTLKLTDLDLSVTPYVGSDGKPLAKPTEVQQQLTSLNYVCMVDGRTLAPSARNMFDWNWVSEKEVGDQHGVIAVSKKVFVDFIVGVILPQIITSCYKPYVHVSIGPKYHYRMDQENDLHKLQITFPDPKQTDGEVAHLHHDGYDYSQRGEGGAEGRMAITTHFDARVKFQGNQIIIIQNLIINLYVRKLATGAKADVVKKTVTDTYDLSVDDTGTVKIKGTSVEADKSDKIGTNAFISLILGFDTLVHDIKTWLTRYTSCNLKRIPLENLQSFVFPGGKTFTFKNVSFSNEARDLLCRITYVDPNSQEGLALSECLIARNQQLVEDINKVASVPPKQLELICSSELMDGYRQYTTMMPEAKFEAVQTVDGHSLLFSVSSNGHLILTMEESNTANGWKQIDLCSGLFARDFSGNSKVKIKTMAVNQCFETKKILLAIVVNDGSVNDQLYLAVNMSAVDLSWTASPNWVKFAFDDTKHTLSSINVVGLFINELPDGHNVVLDVLRNPLLSTKHVFRYYIDTARSTGYAWNPHDVACDFEVEQYSSCLGRSYQSKWAACLYTAGRVVNRSQITCQPLFNAFDPSIPAPPTRLSLPTGQLVDAIASCVVPTDSKYTDLYVAASGSLFYFSYINQRDTTTPICPVTSPLFTNVRKMYASCVRGQVSVFGLNGAGEVFYTSAPAQQVENPSAWSTPVPILSQAENISPYINCINAGNTIFAVNKGAGLQRMMQDPSTTAWKTHPITLAPPSSDFKATKFTCYTTKVQVMCEGSRAEKDTEILLSTKSRGVYYVNNLYTILDTTPLKVKTDCVGCVTVVEPLTGLHGSLLVVSDTKTTQCVLVNPMKNVVQKLLTLNDPAKLRDATIDDGNGNTRKLVSATVAQEDLQATAESLVCFAQARTTIADTEQVMAYHGSASITAPHFFDQSPMIDIFGLATKAGDLFNWLKSGVIYYAKVIKDLATGVWHFVVKIAGLVYSCVLDCIETIAGAIEWVFDKIKTFVVDLWEFLKFLFCWGDIKRCKVVMTHLMHHTLNWGVQSMDKGLDNLQVIIDDELESVKQQIGSWPTLDLGLVNEMVDSKLYGTLTSATSFLFDPFLANCSKLSFHPKVPSTGSSALDQIVSQEKDVTLKFMDQLSDVMKGMKSFDITHLVKAIITVLSSGLLDSAKKVIGTLIHSLKEVLSILNTVLQTPVHIPVVSDILEAVGVPKFTFLDVIGWVAALPFTIIYKLAHKQVPFPDNQATSMLLATTDMNGVFALFNQQNPLMCDVMKEGDPEESVPQLMADVSGLKTTIHVAGHAFSGFAGMAVAVLNPIEAELTKEAIERQVGPIVSPANAVSIIAGLLDSFSVVIATPPKKAVDKACTALSFVRLVHQPLLKSLKMSEDVVTVVDLCLAAASLGFSINTFVSLSKEPAGRNKSSAVVEEVSSVAGCFSCISMAIVQYSKSPYALIPLAIFDATVFGTQFAVAVLPPVPENATPATTEVVINKWDLIKRDSCAQVSAQ